MSEIFDEAAAEPSAPRGRGRGRALLITGAVIVVLIIALTIFASVYTERLWYSSAGYGSVFTKMLWTKVGLFAFFGLLMAASVIATVYLAFRFRPFFRPSSSEQTNLDRYRDVVTPIRTWILVGIAVVVGAFAGTSGMGHWRTFLLWRHAQSFGSSDPYFGKDIGFYVFDLPWWHYLVDFLLAVLVICLIASVLTHYLYGGLRLQSRQDRFSGAAQVQLSVLLGLFVLVKAVDYYLDRFDLVTDKGSLITGMDYTGDNAVLPAKNILIGVSAVCAVLFFVNVWRRTWQLPSVGLALLVLSAVLLGMIWPAAVQQFQVRPSEPVKENSYINSNIVATRDAYDLTGITTQDYSPKTSQASAIEQMIAMSNTKTTPVLDPKLIQPAFENIQQSRSFYSTAPVLDVDHYDIDGIQRPLVLGVRELDQANLPTRNWSNLHTVFTHGNGIIAAYGDGRNEQDDTVASANGSSNSANSGIEFAEGIGQSGNNEDALQRSTGGYEDRIYYGQDSPDYSIVGKASPDAPDVEYNLPTGGKDDADSTTFDGPGDASVGSTFNKLMFAVKFGDPNFLLSGRVNSNSKVLFDRDPRQRVEKVAPWLTVDSDPYPAVVDGRIQWILDGYTTTDRYPGSQRESLDTMTTDAQQLDNGLQPLPTDEINYIRDAVKATVDADTGEVKLYAWDPDDPILKAWEGAFPGTVLPKSDMSPELLEHVRYPEDLFKVQRYQFGRYHVTDANNWYENADRWDVPTDPYTPNTFQAPYRLYADDPDGTTGSQYSLTSVYVPYGKTTLASYLSVDSNYDSDDYGKLRVLDLRANDSTPGPGQIAQEFTSNPEVSAKLTPYTNGSSTAVVSYGNLLTFPVAGSLMNVQPIYTSRQASEATYPQLTFVRVSYRGQIGIAGTLPDALDDLFRNAGTPTSNGNGNGNGNQSGNGNGNGKGKGKGDSATLDQQIAQTERRLKQAFSAANDALADSNLGEYQDQVKLAEQLFTRLMRLQNQATADSGPSTGPTSSPSSTPSSAPSSGSGGLPSGSPSDTASTEPSQSPAP